LGTVGKDHHNGPAGRSCGARGGRQMAEKRSGARSGSASRNHPRSWHGDDPIPRTADGIDARIFRPGQASAQPATP
ncbi:hypothetical protein, partial [Salmonella enterica]|uniref:hypothetical protein n=1 Tax=Salmonella enterica TaxID=28901 RepID=UPI00117AFD85